MKAAIVVKYIQNLEEKNQPISWYVDVNQNEDLVAVELIFESRIPKGMAGELRTMIEKMSGEKTRPRIVAKNRLTFSLKNHKKVKRAYWDAKTEFLSGFSEVVQFMAARS